MSSVQMSVLMHLVKGLMQIIFEPQIFFIATKLIVNGSM